MMKSIEYSTKEPQYQVCLDLVKGKPAASLGLMSNQVWYEDPKRLAFVLSRYKFVAKMLRGVKNALEIGCADAWGSRIVQQEVGILTVSDFDPVFIKDVNARLDPKWKMKTLLHDMLEGPTEEKYEAAYLIDVIEHINPDIENQFLSNIVRSLNKYGICIIGTPSIQSQLYASPPSKAGHVNCKDGIELQALMKVFFHNVFLFSMNDELIHTGFEKMAHYLWVLCANRKE
jgi:hypothetical protein